MSRKDLISKIYGELLQLKKKISQLKLSKRFDMIHKRRCMNGQKTHKKKMFNFLNHQENAN